MIASLIVVIICGLSGVGLLAAMYWRDEPFLGAVGLMVLSVCGVAAMVYGALNSM